MIAAAAQVHPSTIEIKNGIKIVHNMKVPSEQSLRRIGGREDLAIGGESDNEDFVFVRPIQVIADAAGNIYVLDARDCAVKKYDAGGKFVARWGRNGQGPGEFEYPGSISIDEEERIYIGSAGGKVTVFDSRGVFQRTFKMENRLERMMAAGGGRLVMEYDDRLEAGDQIKRISRLAVEKTGQGRIVLYSQDQLPFGAVQNKDFRLEIPLFIRWDVTADGRLYVGTADRYAIRAMALDGRTLFEFTKDYDPLPVPSGILAAAVKQAAESGMFPLKDAAKNYEKHLAHYPVFNSISVDEKGRIWVGLFQKEDSKRTIADSCFDVFSLDGQFLFTTKLDGAVIGRPYFRGGCLYRLRRDADGYVQAVRLRFSNDF